MTYVSSKAEVTVRLVIAFTVIGSFVVLLRLWLRLLIMKKPGFDDLFIFLAMLFSTGYTIAVKIQFEHGLGVHVSQVNKHDYTPLRKALFTGIICNSLALGFIKGSFLVLYFRLFCIIKWIRWAIYGMGTFVALFTIETVFINFVTCIPTRKYWSLATPGRCIDASTLWIVNTSIHLATDFIIFFLPLPVLHHLHLPRRRKYGLVVVFALGFLTSVISIVRLRSSIKIIKGHDWTYDNTDTAVWNSLEMNTGMTCACLPPLHPLFSRCFGMVYKTPADEPGDNFRFSLRRRPPGTATTTTSGQAWSSETDVTGTATTTTSGQAWSSETNVTEKATNSIHSQSKRDRNGSVSMEPLQVTCGVRTGSEHLEHARNGQITIVRDIYQNDGAGRGGYSC